MKKFLLGFLAALGLGLTLTTAKPVQADSVAIPFRDSAFLSYPYTDKDYPVYLFSPTDSYVPGLSAWKVTNTIKVQPYYPAPWENVIYPSEQAFEVGPNLWLTNMQAFLLPVGEVVSQPISKPEDSTAFGKIEATVSSETPVALWATHDYKTPVQWVAPNSGWHIIRYYYSDDSGLWFDLGSNQWIPAYYVNNQVYA
ncbi:MAG: hypothetical protein LKF36_01310 [Lactobacillus sp.]|jgi:hypothetical protein|nr:hypothetical protein [Lactobacillus sp.]